jgi:hypothetical protein
VSGAGAATWFIAAAAGILLAAASYVRAGPAGFAGRAAVLLRWIAASLLVALVLDAPVGRAGSDAPLLALDASLSWHAQPDDAWDRARAAVARADSVLLFGDSVRVAGSAPAEPGDAASRVGPLVDRAAAAGRPVRIITDGRLGDADALARLPRGSRVEVVDASTASDLALVSIHAPPAALSGDTLDVRVMLSAGRTGSPARRLTLQLGSPRAEVDVPEVPPYGESEVSARLPVAVPVGDHVLLATLVPDESDGAPANDTLGVAITVSEAAGAVLVSTSPDYDVRGVLAVLRGTSQLPTRAYLRVAPGAWREEGSLAPVSESAVRAAVNSAPLVVLHGDTAVFGRPGAASRGAHLLIPAPPAQASREWYPVGAPLSPLSVALAGVPWDSLAPLTIGGQPAAADWRGLDLSRNRGPERVSPVAGWDRQPRRAVVAASGFWRWEFRGGAGVDAYRAFWGALLDWLSAERADPRRVVPSEFVLRAGEPVRWRRTSDADSVVRISLERVGNLTPSPAGSAAGDSVTTLELTFGAGEAESVSPPLGVGRWRARMEGGEALLSVNSARELLPMRPTVEGGEVGAAPVVVTQRGARSLGWLYLLVVAALCVEWLLRRRVGLR